MSGPDVGGAALAAHDAGLCVVRVASDGSKSPKGQWKQYQRQRPSRDEVDGWFRDGWPGMGVICGAVSGGLEMLELEGRAVAEGLADELDRLCETHGLTDLLRRIADGYLEHTPSGGLHLLYRCEEIAGSVVLAQRPATPAELAEKPSQRVKVLCETRGEGGFVVTAPSNGTTHPTGKAWELISGGFATIATITRDERRRLHEVCRLLDQMPQEPPPCDRPPRTTHERVIDDAARGGPSWVSAVVESWVSAVVEDYNRRTTWHEVLAGVLTWHKDIGRETYWYVEGSDNVYGATTNRNGTDRLLWFSSSCPPGFVHYQGKRPTPTYDRFSAHVILTEGRDDTDTRVRVARRLREAGYGPPLSSSGAGASSSSSGATGAQKAASDASDPEIPRVRFRLHSVDELLELAERRLTWLAKGLLIDGTYGQHAGSMKSLKSHVAMALQVGVAAGVPVMGQWDVPTRRPVLTYIGEGGAPSYGRRLVRWARAHGVDPRELRGWIHATNDIAPVSSLAFVEGLKRNLDETGAGLFVLDPYYAFHGSEVDAKSLHAEGEQLAYLTSICADRGCVLWVLNHLNKTGSGDGLHRINNAGSGEWVDSWILSSHRETPNVDAGTFRLSLDVGSRQWGGSTWNVDVNLGRFDDELVDHVEEITFSVRRRTDRVEADPDAAEKAADVEIRLDVFRVFRKARGDGWLTRQEILDRVGKQRVRVVRAITAMTDEGRLEIEERPYLDASKRKQTRTVYRPSEACRQADPEVAVVADLDALTLFGSDAA